MVMRMTSMTMMVKNKKKPSIHNRKMKKKKEMKKQKKMKKERKRRIY